MCLCISAILHLRARYNGAFCVRFDNNSLNNIFIASASRSSNNITTKYMCLTISNRGALCAACTSYARGILRTSGVHRVDSITQFSGAPRKGTYYLRLLAGWLAAAHPCKSLHRAAVASHDPVTHRPGSGEKIQRQFYLREKWKLRSLFGVICYSRRREL